MIDPLRSTVRTAFAALLETYLTGTNNPAQTVKAFRWGGMKGESPVVVVSSDGTLRQRLTFQGTIPVYTLQVDVFVLYSVPENPAYTEQDAENLLDLIEFKISQVIDSNQKNAAWDGINQPTASVREDISIGGVEYIREYMILEFT